MLVKTLSTAAAVKNLFILVVVCSNRFRTDVIGGARGLIMDSSYIAKQTPSGGLYGLE